MRRSDLAGGSNGPVDRPAGTSLLRRLAAPRGPPAWAAGVHASSRRCRRLLPKSLHLMQGNIPTAPERFCYCDLKEALRRLYLWGFDCDRVCRWDRYSSKRTEDGFESDLRAGLLRRAFMRRPLWNATAATEAAPDAQSNAPATASVPRKSDSSTVLRAGPRVGVVSCLRRCEDPPRSAARGIAIASLTGTFNMCHPDVEHCRTGLRRLRVLAEACREMGTSSIHVCTGTRDPNSMWRPHPDNGSPESWRDMAACMREATDIARQANVVLAFEPEMSNVVDSARKARRLLDESR